MFTYPDGRPLGLDIVPHTLAKVIVKAGMPHICFHDLRYSHATLLLKSGVHPKIVSERLGHANISIILDTYSHVLLGLQEKTAECFDNLITRENGGKMVATGSSPRSVGR